VHNLWCTRDCLERRCAAPAACRTWAAAPGRLCLGLRLLGKVRAFLSLGSGYLDQWTAWRSLGPRPLGPSWKRMALRSRPLGAV